MSTNTLAPRGGSRGRGRGRRQNDRGGKPMVVHEPRPEYPNVEIDVKMGNQHSRVDMPAPQPTRVEEEEESSDSDDEETPQSSGPTQQHQPEDDEDEDEEDDDEDDDDEDDENGGTQMNGKMLIDDARAPPEGIQIPDVYHQQMYQQPPPQQQQYMPPPPAARAPSQTDPTGGASRELVSKLITIARIRRVCPRDIRDFDRRFNVDTPYEELKLAYQTFKVEATVASQIGQWRHGIQFLAFAMEKAAGMQNIIPLNLRNWHQTINDQLDNEDFDGILAEMVGEGSANTPAWQRALIMLLGSAVTYNTYSAATGINQSDPRSLAYNTHNRPPPQPAPPMFGFSKGGKGGSVPPAPLFASAHAPMTEPLPFRSEEETRKAMMAKRAERQAEVTVNQVILPPPIREEKRLGQLPTAQDIDDYCSDTDSSKKRKRNDVPPPQIAAKKPKLVLKVRQPTKEPEVSEEDDEEEEDEDEDEEEDDDDDEEDEEDEEEESDDTDTDDMPREETVKSIPMSVRSRINAMRQKASLDPSNHLPKRVQNQPGPPPPMDPKAGGKLIVDVNVDKLKAL